MTELRSIEGGGENPADPEALRDETGLRAVDASEPGAEEAAEEEEVVREQDMSLRDVEKALKKAKRRKEPAVISGRVIDDPAQALLNLEGALITVKKHLKVDKSSLFFSNFSGQTVGEADETGTYVDALQLMHPAERLAHNIGHEVAHMKGRVDSEGLVEAYLRAIGVIQGEGNAIETTAKYDKMLEQFNEFVDRARGKKDPKAFVKKIYDLYYRKKDESIFRFYEKNYIRGLKTEEEKGQAMRDFEEVFPELSVKLDSGNYEVTRISDVVEVDEYTGGDVVDLDSVRGSVEETEGKVVNG